MGRSEFFFQEKKLLQFLAEKLSLSKRYDALFVS